MCRAYSALCVFSSRTQACGLGLYVTGLQPSGARRWGMLAHVNPGATVEFYKIPVGDGHWIYSHIDEHRSIALRAVSWSCRSALNEI